MGSHGIPHFATYPPGMLNFAAAAAAAAAHHHPIPWMQHPHHPHPQHHPSSAAAAAAAHPLYPWLMAKHPRLFPHRFGPGKRKFYVVVMAVSYSEISNSR